ncbi:MAG: prolyl oligopeptidase family serine peptidase [Gemmatimonadetes bacterium]|nr:prolyl oligopeptidase family serine peptidase [Gemmatimonadota bacterium]
MTRRRDTARVRWRPGTAVAVVVGWLAATPLLGQTSYTLDDILAAPFATDLVASPSDAAFAWIRYDRGARNIWVAEGPEFVGRRITSWSDDDGQDLGQLRFTPDGRNVVFVRGGGPNRAGEIPNPDSEPEPAERALWVASLDGTSRRLAEGTAPVVSPTGERVAFLQRGQVHVASLTGDPAVEPLFLIRGSAGALSWSPSADRLAFVSNRGDHAFVGVFDVATREVRYLDPSLDRDGSPVWSPDGRELAFIRTPNEGSRLPFSPVRSALPWSIRVVDVESGAAREIWRAAPGRGSAFHGVSGPQLGWLASDHLVFPWERDGWTRLYAVAVTGGEAVSLSPGDGEVEHVTISSDRSGVVFSSNSGDIDRRHVWRTAPGQSAERLTSGTGIEWGPAVAADGRTVAFLASDATTPAHAQVLSGGTRRAMVTGFMPAQFPHAELVEPEQVVFTSEDGLRIHGQLFLPPGPSVERRPAAIFFHGGSRRQMLLGWHYLRYYHNTYALNQYLASRGYVVLSVNYRSGTGYGLEFREAIDYGARGASEYRDVVAAGAYLASRDDVDASRIGLWGGSYGGYLTALGLARNSDMFAAGVDIHGVHDWNVVIRNFVPSYQPEAREAFARLAYRSSPMAWIDGWTSPVLLIHGDDDRNVPFSESVDLIEALRTRGVEVEQLVFPDEVHGFLLHRNWLAAFEAASRFMDERLMGPTAAGDAP